MRNRLLSLLPIAFAAAVAAVAVAVPEPADAAEVRRPAASHLADRDDDGRAARSRPGVVYRDDRDGRRGDDRRDDGWYSRNDRRDDRRGRGYGDNGRWDDRRDRGWSRHRGGAFPFLGGARGLELHALPRYSDLDGRDLERILGRRAFDRLEHEARRAGLGGPFWGVLSTRGHDLRLDLSVGNVFVGRLIDRNGDWVIDESRASEQFHRRVGRRR